MGSDEAGLRHRVSIGIPVYNGERYIRKAIESILCQTYRECEVIISDNASVDGTAAICQEYVHRDPRVRYLRNATNVGANRNFNRVFELSTGHYFKLANADDVAAPTLVERCVEVLNQQPEVVLCYGRATLIDELGRDLGSYDDELDLRSPNPPARFRLALRNTRLVNVMQGVVRSDVLRRIALLGHYPGADMALVAELTLYGQFHELPDRLFFRRLHATASSSLKTVEDVQAYVDPSRTHKRPRLLSQRFASYLTGIWRAPLRSHQKLSLTWHILRLALASRHEFTREWIARRHIGPPLAHL